MLIIIVKRQYIRSKQAVQLGRIAALSAAVAVAVAAAVAAAAAAWSSSSKVHARDSPCSLT